MESQPKSSPGYQSYLLRLRWLHKDGQSMCQIMLRSVSTRDQYFFADMDSFVAFLEQQADQRANILKQQVEKETNLTHQS